MSWLGNCTRCGQPTVSTKDPGYRDSDYVQDESGHGVRHVRCPGTWKRIVHARQAPPSRNSPGNGQSRQSILDALVRRQPQASGHTTVKPPPGLPASASPIEARFWAACLKLGAPELDGLVAQHPAGRYRIDFALPGRKIGIELDGFASHSSTADIEHDRFRQRFLEGHGWYIIRFGGREVHRDADYCAQQAAWLAGHARREASS